MDAILRDQLRAEAIRIGDHLLAQAVVHADGLAWKTFMDPRDPSITGQQTPLYSGGCGFAWFLLELYRQTGREQYLSAARGGLAWAEAQPTPSPFARQVLYTGDLSVPFTQLAFYRVTGERAYLDRALQWVRARESSLAENDTMEFLNGLSGALTCLLHLHAAAPEPWLLGLIDACAARLVTQARLGPQGIYWDRTPANVHGLCGFSHGAAGIGFVLLELGRYLGNDAYYWLAGQAFRYEAPYWVPDWQNWLDLRRSITDPDEEKRFEAAYRNADLSFFTQGFFIDAWCHGAAGIGLTRWRAYELLGEEQYLSQAQQALETTRLGESQRHETSTFTLCHGGGGNAEAFLEAYRITGNEAYREDALAIARRSLRSHQALGRYQSGFREPIEDYSLFMGTTGVGYFYLRLLDPQGSSPLLAPRLDGARACGSDLRPYEHLCLSRAAVQHQVLRGTFPATVAGVDAALPGLIPEQLSRTSPGADLATVLAEIMEAEPVRAAGQNGLLPEIFRVESFQHRLNHAVASDALLHYYQRKKIEDAQRINALDEEAFARQLLLADPASAIVESRWTGPTGDGDPEDEESALLLTPTVAGVRISPLAPLAHAVLSETVTPSTPAEIVREIADQLGIDTEAGLGQVRGMILSQVREAVASGLLIDPAQHPLAGAVRRALAPEALVPAGENAGK